MSFGLFLRDGTPAPEEYLFDVFASPRDDGDDGLDDMARLRRREKERTSLDRPRLRVREGRVPLVIRSYCIAFRFFRAAA